MKTLLSAAGFSLALGVAALAAPSLTACGTSNSCAAGYEGCACNLEGNCNPGLECRSNLCVSLDGSGGNTSGVGGLGQGGDDGSGGDTSGTGSTASTGSATGTGGGGGIECIEGETSGTCGGGNAEVCIDGQWAPNASCDACNLMSPTSNCNYVSSFLLDDAYQPVAGGVTSESYTTSSASATFNFTELGQTGFVQFAFIGAVQPYDVSVLGASSPNYDTYVDVSLESGTTMGCQYGMVGGYLDYDPYAGSGCWGGLQPMGWDELNGVSSPGIPSGPVTVLNVRLQPPTTGQITLTVTSVGLYLN
jgi:hypothetical protein